MEEKDIRAFIDMHQEEVSQVKRKKTTYFSSPQLSTTVSQILRIMMTEDIFDQANI